MRAFRRTVAAAVLVLVTGGLGQTAAQADTTPISILSAQTSPDNNGKFDVSLTAASPVTTIKATLYNVATNQEAAMVSDFKLSSGTATNGAWEPVERVKLPDLGSYRIDLTVTDTAGDTVSKTGAGYFYYQVQTFFQDVRVDRKTVDYAHQQATISGQLMGRWPATGQVAPVSGAQVEISNVYWEDNAPTTGAHGEFASTETMTQAGPLQAIFPYGNVPNYGGSSSAEIPIDLVQSATEVVLNPSSQSVPYQGSVTANATFLWDSPTGWQPLAGKQVGVDGCGLHSMQFTTDANGGIAIPSGGPLTYNCTLLAGWTSDNPYLKDAQATVTVTVIQPAAFSDFSATRTDASNVAVSGHMQFTGLAVPASPLVDIQYSSDGTTGWTTVATGLTANWDGTGYAFSSTVPSAEAGYWRAVFEPYQGFTDASSSVVYVTAASS